jgi:hypothetical protein
VVAFVLGGCAGAGSAAKTQQLTPGMHPEQVRALLGDPTQTQFLDNKLVWRYQLHDTTRDWVPYYLVFNSQTQELEGWFVNEAEYQQMRARRWFRRSQ